MEYSFIKEILEAYREKGFFPSASVCIFDKDRTLFTETAGDVTKDTWYDMASVSKIVCTTMILFLMEEGLLTPDSEILTLLPEKELGPVTKTRLAGVTVRQIMTHTSGIVPWFPFYSDGRPFYVILERVLSSTPKENGMAYSDLNFMLMGLVFTQLSGLTLREGLEEYIRPITGDGILYGPVDPAVCAPSCYGNQIEKEMCAERHLPFYGWRRDGVAVSGSCNDGNAHYYWKGASGHAGIFAQAEALAKLCRFYMNTEKKYFREAMETDICERGLGFDKTVTYPEGCGHSGFTGTSIWFSKAHNIGAVLLTNKYYRLEGTPGNTNEFRRAVHYALLGKEAPVIL